MTALYFGFLLLLALAVVLTLRALRLRGAVVPANETRRDKNVELYRLHLADLEAQHARGELDAAQLAELKKDLQRNLLAEVPAGTEHIGASEQGRGLFWFVVVLVPLLAMPLYLHVGANDELRLTQWYEEKHELQMSGETVPPELYRNLEQALERQLEHQPRHLDYRVLAARLALEQNQYAHAEAHYQAALEMLPDNPSLLLEWAQARFSATGRADDGVRDAMQAVLQADPMNRVALEILGIHAFEAEEYERALHYWGIALRQSSPQSQRAQTLWQGIQQARSRLGEQEGLRIAARVKLDEQLDADADSAVFLAVRRQGSDMPVLAQRYRVGDLPLEVTLDNSMGMLPGNLLDDTGFWEVIARVSHHGSATPLAGDLEGVSGPLRLPLAGPVEVVIDSRRP